MTVVIVAVITCGTRAHRATTARLRAGLESTHGLTFAADASVATVGRWERFTIVVEFPVVGALVNFSTFARVIDLDVGDVGLTSIVVSFAVATTHGVEAFCAGLRTDLASPHRIGRFAATIGHDAHLRLILTDDALDATASLGGRARQRGTGHFPIVTGASVTAIAF